MYAKKTPSSTRPSLLNSKPGRGNSRSASGHPMRKDLFAAKPSEKTVRSSSVKKRFMVIENAITRNEDETASQQRELQAFRMDFDELKIMVTNGLGKLGSQLNRVVKAVQLLSEAQDNAPPGRHHYPKEGYLSRPEATLEGGNRPRNDVRPFIHNKARPLNSLGDPAERAVVERELNDTRRDRGESDGLFNEKGEVPPNVVRDTHDIFAGSQVEAASDLGQLRFMHTPPYKVEAAHAIKNHDELQAFMDQAREQCQSFVKHLVED